MKRILGKTAGGFTLAEAMVAVVVLCIAAAGVLMPFTAGARSRMEGQRRTLAAKLASDLVEKVVATDFNDILIEYHEDEGQIKDMRGNTFTDPVYAGFSRAAVCEKVWLNPETGDARPMFIRCTVNVFYNGGEVASVSRLISK